MSFVDTITPSMSAGISVTDRSENLSAFRKPDCAAAIWHRQTPADVQNWVDSLDPAQLPQGRVVVRPKAVQIAVGEFCGVSKTPICRERTELIEDIAALAGIFSGLMRAPYLRLRLQAVTSNACRKFHIDATTARLVCTYRGTGTQYGITQGGDDPRRVFTVPTGAPVLLRGSLWPETPASGLVHRSPPIEGTGETRLVLVLDAVNDMETAE